MPCRDYESDNGYNMKEHYKEQCDRLARIACAAMEELEKQGKEDFLILKNEEVAQWWAKHKAADRQEKARIAEEERKARVKQQALDRLTDEEKELLGLNKKKKVGTPFPVKEIDWTVSEKYDMEEAEDTMSYIETIKGILKR